MSVYLKAYWIWTAAHIVAIVWLLAFTDLRLNWWQAALLVLAVNFYGASQRNFERHDLRRRA